MGEQPFFRTTESNNVWRARCPRCPRCHRRHGREREQPAQRLRQHSETPLHRRRRLRIREVLAGLRHHRGGIAAADQRDVLVLRAGFHAVDGAATDVTPMLRVLYSRIAEPNAGGPGASSFNVPSVTGKKKVVKHFSRTGGMCPTCAGTGRASRFDEA